MPFDDRVSSDDSDRGLLRPLPPPVGRSGPPWFKNLIWLSVIGVVLLVGGCVVLISLSDGLHTSAFLCDKAFEGSPVQETYAKQQEFIEKCLDEGYLPDYLR